MSLFFFFAFIFMNGTAVGQTFFLLPLISEKWLLVAQKFVSVNIVTFVVAEILVLIWGLIVALARMAREKGQWTALRETAAADAVMRWRYVPGKRGGVPETMWFQVPIEFKLGNE